ncbi:phosphoadenosine phosphosulfate reductase domain-containing protein [Ferviditalea candida]|uniref:Phosphoadenosine phosphosulfate reductase family protein n=1 Tax=Ferviditalea candida TaxID=3108399 RepID=A0ABU5ZLI6_9BACL|nr:phosphoadenosine phosphosulfate reductase family protein [Paenibacillaceae bacterium T2]
MGRKIKHVAMFSGGAASAYVAYLMVQTYGKENCLLFFTDTLWEHPDNYRFMYDVAEYIGIEFLRVMDGRTPEEVFMETRFLGNSRLAKCSSELKVRQTTIFIEQLRIEGYEPILYFGIGPHEKQRQKNLIDFYAHQALEPVETRFPLINSILNDKDLKSIIENEWKIKLPLMYDEGFSHANCGGRCVRGGLNHYEHLYKTWPDVYKQQEEMENRLRDMLGNVTILKRDSQPLTLKQFREEIEAGMRVEASNPAENDTVPCVCVFN